MKVGEWVRVVMNDYNSYGHSYDVHITDITKEKIVGDYIYAATSHPVGSFPFTSISSIQTIDDPSPKTYTAIISLEYELTTEATSLDEAETKINKMLTERLGDNRILSIRS